MIQVDLGREATKSGVDQAEVLQIVEALKQCEHLRLTGLMTLPPYFDDAEQVRPFFRKFARVARRTQSRGAFGDLRGELSMGMTHDYESRSQKAQPSCASARRFLASGKKV